ncbi:MAG TPA: acyl-CoA dehydrogenase [Actinocrinis sp.]|nr:acyl-CoA dehydrogenase [Actinocrinis sp.]
MTHYRSNLRDLRFNLFEVFGTGRSLGSGPVADLDPGTAQDLLGEVERLAGGPIAASYAEVDRTPPVYEKKMGLKVSTTCELTFSQDEPAIGWLLGEEHNGIAQMFQVIEWARMQVGVKAIGTLSTGYLNALDCARTRVQGADPTRAADKTAPRVTIDRHPDVRRMLMLQKAYAEGLRATYIYTADWLDRATLARHAGDTEAAALAENVNDLLLPIVKGFGSERSYELLALSLQTFGGSGYLQDYPIEQYVRDTKIDTLYEGTTGIQGQDFLFRKIVRDKEVALTTLFGEIEQTLAAVAGEPRLAATAAALAQALADVRAMVAAMLGWQAEAAAEPTEVYKVGQNTTRLLMSVGDLVVGWLLTKQAAVAVQAQDRDAGSGGQGEGGVDRKGDADFYAGKVAVARFFSAGALPELGARRAALTSTDNTLMELADGAF